MLKDVKTALYLDCDMLVRFDVRELFSIDLESNMAGAITDAEPVLREHRLKAKNADSKDMLLDGTYFNSGFLLLNLDSINPSTFWTDSVKIINEYELQFPDQDVLNIIFKDRTLKLSLAYNFMLPYFLCLPVEFCSDENEIYDIAYTRNEYNIAKNNVKIYHYTFPKPWKSLSEQAWIWEHHGVDARGHRVNIIEKMWWINALNTPIFAPELRGLKEELNNDKMDYAEFMKLKLNEVQKNIANTKSNINSLESKLRKKARHRDRIYLTLITILTIALIAHIFV